jgi:hypothetical protein
MLVVRLGILLVIATTFLMGTVRVFAEVPGAQGVYDRQDALVRHLVDIGVTRIYSEYWTCNRIIFRSQERVICASLNEQLGPGFDRYEPYREIVGAARHPAYVFPVGSLQAVALERKYSDDGHYRRSVFEGYVIYEYRE